MVSLWHSKTGLREVDKTVVKVIHITWESAVLPSICMIIAVGLYHAAPVRHHTVLSLLIISEILWLEIRRSPRSVLRSVDRKILYFRNVANSQFTPEPTP